MQAVRRTLERVYNDGITDDWDRVVLVVGDEGVGKSTFMLNCAIHWKDIKNERAHADDILDQLVWGGRQEFQNALTSATQQSVIPVMDAARVLHNLEVQVAEQREIQKDLLDIRVQNYLFLLGFQSWDDVPKFLRKRRAKNAFVIPRRGYVRGYNRSAIDEKHERGEWPDPQLRDNFPSLEGLDIWDRFEQRDETEKMDRIEASQDPNVDDVRRNVAIKVVLRAVKPWADDAGFEQKEAAKLVDYSDTWVSNRMDDWRDGYYRELFDPGELQRIENTTGKTITA